MLRVDALLPAAQPRFGALDFKFFEDFLHVALPVLALSGLAPGAVKLLEN